MIAAAGPGANRTYGSYWQRVLTAWGDRRLDQITATDIEAMQHQAAATARRRRNARRGRHAGEHVIAAARAIYNRAIADDLIHPIASPAHRVAKPRRLPSTRRALTPNELDQINTAARTSGNDVILDALLLRLHTETACRRGGALALHLADLDTTHCLLLLRERAAPSAGKLLETRAPDQALCEWMDRLARFAVAKAGLADAMRQTIGTSAASAQPGYALVVAAIEALLEANHEAGTVRPGVTADDFILAIAGIWQIDAHGDWQSQAARLLDLMMDGLRTGAPGRG